MRPVPSSVRSRPSASWRNDPEKGDGVSDAHPPTLFDLPSFRHPQLSLLAACRVDIVTPGCAHRHNGAMRAHWSES